ncbi:Ethanolaminephosphotransferase 1 [Nymphon striatum]|nr:Ethanolaminephosphotransferase 1 [Nymphon striatum]
MASSNARYDNVDNVSDTLSSSSEISEDEIDLSSCEDYCEEIGGWGKCVEPYKFQPLKSYSAIDTSPVSRYICHPFWNSVVQLFPKWIAPNVLTFVGFMFCVTNYLMLSWYDFDFYASSDIYPEYLPVPELIWLLCAIFQFISHTLDAVPDDKPWDSHTLPNFININVLSEFFNGIDGKQARQTNTSGPLGELFDHGLDSWATLFLPSAFISVFGREDFSIPVHRIFFLLLTIHVGFMLSHFEKYNTGVLYLPWSYDISQISMFILYIISSVFGYKVWKKQIPFTLLNGANCVEMAIYAGGFCMSMPITIYNIYISFKDKTGRMHPPFELIRPLVSTIAMSALTELIDQLFYVFEKGKIFLVQLPSSANCIGFDYI